MTVTEPDVEEQLVKSRQRVKAHGEVFTPRHMVEKMLDLVHEDLEAGPDFVDKTFLEPAAGDGNFLIAILRRKLRAIEKQLPPELWPTESLFALASIYGIELLEDNHQSRLELGRAWFFVATDLGVFTSDDVLPVVVKGVIEADQVDCYRRLLKSRLTQSRRVQVAEMLPGCPEHRIQRQAAPAAVLFGGPALWLRRRCPRPWRPRLPGAQPLGGLGA